MGLDTSHDAWHGAYSAFMRWRCELARAAGLPPLGLMEGFYAKGDYGDPIKFARQALNSETAFANIAESLPIKWECLKPSALHTLLHHSDCEGEIAWEDCGPIADALEALLPKLPSGDGGRHVGNWRDKTAQFIKGCRAAFEAKESLEFH